MTERCAGCGRDVPVEQLDIVDFGTGYRCQGCTEAGAVAQYIEASAEYERKEGRREGWEARRWWQFFWRW